MRKSWVCLDANIIIPVLVPHPLSHQTELLFKEWGTKKAILIAPALLAFEVTATIRRFVHLGEISSVRGSEAIKQFLQMPLRLSSRRSLFPLAFQLANEFGLPRAYDSAYLALAKLSDCEFWTADARLYNSVHHKLPWVKYVGLSQAS